MKPTNSEIGQKPTEKPTKIGMQAGGPVATTSLNSVAENQPHKAIGNYGQSLEPQQKKKFRAWIGVRIEALLDGYWQNRPSDVVKNEILLDWMAGLQKFTPEEIRSACREWQNERPRVKPNVGDIAGIISGNRDTAEIMARPKTENTYRKATPEEDAAYMATSGRGCINEERRAEAEKIMRGLGFETKRVSK